MPGILSGSCFWDECGWRGRTNDVLKAEKRCECAFGSANFGSGGTDGARFSRVELGEVASGAVGMARWPNGLTCRISIRSWVTTTSSADAA